MRPTGVMAPPDLYEQPATTGLMSPGAQGSAQPINLHAFLWAVATVLAAVELCLEATLP